MSNYYEYRASDILKFNLGDFEGPIDLLYTLIVKEGKYDILTFPLSQITNQYMDYMKQLDTLDMDIASEFVLVATTLLEIKSRDVLPKEEIEYDEYEEYQGDPEELLRMRILMYGLFKSQSETLKTMEQRGKFYRKPMWSNDDAILVINKFDFNMLVDTYGQMLIRFSDRESKMNSKKIVKDRFTVQEKINFLSQMIMEKKQIMFSNLFDENSSTSEVISTFQALLELMKKQMVKATQQDNKSDIIIKLNEDNDDNINSVDLTIIQGEYHE